MSALKIKIYVDYLVIKEWDDWKRCDQEFIEECAVKNNVKMRYTAERDELRVSGKIEDLYYFLHNVCYRYDVELI